MKIKNPFFLFMFLLFNALAFCSATSVTVYDTGFDNQYLEAASTNNPVFHMKVNADSGGDTILGFSLKNVLDSLGYGIHAGEPTSILSGSVKVWRVSPDSPVFNPSSGSTTLIGTMTVSSSTHWSSVMNQYVANGDGVWVTADMQVFPDFGVIQMQTSSLSFAGNAGLNSLNQPAAPPSLLVTSSTAANNLEIAHFSGNMQSFVSTGQDNIIACRLNFINNSGSDSAPVQVNAVTITVDNSYNPAEIMSSIKLQDSVQGTVYGELRDYQFPPGITPIRIPVNINIPANTTVTANIVIAITTNQASANDTFALDLVSSSGVEAVDSYTGKPCSVNPAFYDSFPMASTFATIQKKAVQADMDFDGTIIPANISKGQTNIPLSVLTITNPGDSSSAFIEVYSIRVHLKDSTGAQLVPNALFSKISVTNQSGDTTYGYKTSATLESSGNMITIPLAYPIAIPPDSYVKVTIKADISAATTLNNFMMGIESTGEVLARDKNSYLSIPVNDPAAAPYYSNLTLLTSSFKIVHDAFMPANIYRGQAQVKPMTLTFSNPLIYGSGTLEIRGITLTVQDSSGAAINADSVLSGINVFTPAGSFTWAPPGSDQLYIPFPPGTLGLSSINTSASVSFTVSIKQSPASASLQFSLDSEAMIDAYQVTDPGRKIYIVAASGDSFPMTSGKGTLSGNASDASFSSYPNPFSPGKPARFAYYLDRPSKVTIRIYDISGTLCAKIIDQADRAAGSHSEDTWTGTGINGKQILAGTYLAEITVKPVSGSEKKSVKKITFIK